MSRSPRKKWTSGELLLAAAMILCLAAAGVMIWLFASTTKENREAAQDYDQLESYVQVVVTPVPGSEPTEAVAPLGEDAELLALLQSESQSSQPPRLTPAPTEAAGDAFGLFEDSIYQLQARPKETATVVTPDPESEPDAAAPHLAETLAPSVAPSLSPTPAPTATPSPTPAPAVGAAVQETVRYTVDFDALREINPDVRGWLLQEGTDVNYPVVQAEDNDYYLTHLFNGAENKTGSIFLDCGNGEYLSDMVNYLYGHNRKDGKMFASLPRYVSASYFASHPSFILLTPYGDYRLEVFSCMRGNVEEKEGWHLKRMESRADFEETVEGILARSCIRTGVEPEWGDRLLALCTCTNEVHEERYVVFTRMRPIVYQDEEQISLDSRDMIELLQREGISGDIELPGLGAYPYYAQNDPVWAELLYGGEKGAARKLGKAGSAPACMAMVAAKLVEPENLWWLSYYSGREEGLTFCSCSVNQYRCNGRHVQLRLETSAEFRKYLPVALAAFATGVNQRGENYLSEGDTRPLFFKRVCDVFRLDFSMSVVPYEARTALAQGKMIVTLAGGGKTPFYNGEHYVLLAAADADYVYILDPYATDKYEKKPKAPVEQLAPGLLRAPLADWEALGFGAYYMIGK